MERKKKRTGGNNFFLFPSIIYLIEYYIISYYFCLSFRSEDKKKDLEEALQNAERNEFFSVDPNRSKAKLEGAFSPPLSFNLSLCLIYLSSSLASSYLHQY